MDATEGAGCEFWLSFVLCLCRAENGIPIPQWSKLASLSSPLSLPLPFLSPPYPFVVNYRWIDWTFLVTEVDCHFTDRPVPNINFIHEDSLS